MRPHNLLFILFCISSLVTSCASEPAAVVVTRRPDAALIQPCERAQGAVPVPLPYRILLQLWVQAEELLERCAQSKDRLIEFERDVPPPKEPKT